MTTVFWGEAIYTNPKLTFLSFSLALLPMYLEKELSTFSDTK